MKIIGMDIDGVLTDFEWFQNQFGLKHFQKMRKETVEVNIKGKTISEKFNCSCAEEKKFYIKYFLWYSIKMPIRENVAKVIQTMREQGNTVYLITGRALSCRKSILGLISRSCLKYWLKKHKVKYDAIYFVSTENSAFEKSELCQTLKIDYFIEDSLDNIAELRKHCKIICMQAEYNSGLDGVAYVMDFLEVYQVLSESTSKVVLSSEQRKQLNNLEVTNYFENLQKYYGKLPFDEYYYNRLKRNTFILFRIPYLFMKMIYDIRISGDELNNDARGMIYICNHRKSFDIPLCYYIMNYCNSYSRFLSKREYEGAWFSIIQRSVGTVYVNRDERKSGIVAQNLLIQTILNGGNILIYPEGTRNRTVENLLPFKFGALYIAQVTGAPIVPIIIRNLAKKKYNVLIGKQIKIKFDDSLEEKRNECWNEMNCMYEKMACKNT